MVRLGVVTVIITGQGAGVTSYMECSARKYSRTSIISNSDISPSNTMEVSVHLRAAPRELRNAGAGVVIQKKPDVPRFLGSRSL